MVGIGTDIGPTAAKAAVVETDNAIAWTCVMPTGYSSVDAAERLRGELAAAGYDVTGDDVRVIATGYGRVAVPYANKVVTGDPSSSPNRSTTKAFSHRPPVR